MHTEGVRYAQACAEIMRVLDAVQHEEQRISANALNDVMQVVLHRRGRYARRHTLMARVSGEPVETQSVHGHHAHTAACRKLA